MKGFLPAALAIVGTSVLYMYSGYDDATGLRASSFPNRQLRLHNPKSINPSFADPKNVMVKQEIEPPFIDQTVPNPAAPDPVDNSNNLSLSLRASNTQRQLLLLDPKTVEARQPTHILPPCNVQDIGLGRWIYQHHDAAVSTFKFKEADPASATWAPLRCSVPHLEWHPSSVLECAAVKNINKIVILGGSTSRYILGDFKNWLEMGDNNKNLSNNLQTNTHSKEQISASIMGNQLYLEAIQQTCADPSGCLLNCCWSEFLQNPKFYENTLVLFNSGLWDQRMNDFDKYERDTNNLAIAFETYKKDHPTNRVIWRTFGTPNWNRLDAGQGSARARERLLNPDAVMVYNTVAAEAMLSRGIEIFDDYFMVLGRPEETRGLNDGLYPSTTMNLELMRLLLSVVCNESKD